MAAWRAVARLCAASCLCAADLLPEEAGGESCSAADASAAPSTSSLLQRRAARTRAERLPAEAPPEAAPAAAASGVDARRVVYGKYYAKDGSGRKNRTANSYFLYRPSGHDASRSDKLPVIVQVHGGGFTGGSPYTRADDAVMAAVARGIAYVSVGYRLVATKYYFDDDQPEEFIHVDADGRLTLSATGRTMADYQIRRGHTEYVTKCLYDAAQMMEHLVAHAKSFGIDVHRISFAGSSAGGAEIHYLTWVYHQWNEGKYTPRGMVYTNGQLDYPVQSALDRVWTHWADTVGEGTLLSTVLDQDDCGDIVGNPHCSGSYDYNLCNRTYTDGAVGRFCGAGFGTATLGRVRDALVWPRDDPEVGKGMEALWYTSRNMQKHAPKPFYLYVASGAGGTSGSSFAHHAAYASGFARYAQAAGIDYTVYYPDYPAMGSEGGRGAGRERFREGPRVWNYRSSHGWIAQPGVPHQRTGSPGEQLLYHCLVLGVDCTADTAAPSPPP